MSLGKAQVYLGFQLGVSKCLGAGIIWRTLQINLGMTPSLVFIGSVEWGNHVWPLPVAWASHSMAFGSEKEHLKKGMAFPGELGRTCLGFSDLALEIFQFHFYQTLLATEGINLSVLEGT